METILLTVLLLLNLITPEQAKVFNYNESYGIYSSHKDKVQEYVVKEQVSGWELN